MEHARRHGHILLAIPSRRNDGLVVRLSKQFLQRMLRYVLTYSGPSLSYQPLLGTYTIVSVPPPLGIFIIDSRRCDVLNDFSNADVSSPRVYRPLILLPLSISAYRDSLACRSTISTVCNHYTTCITFYTQVNLSILLFILLLDYDQDSTQCLFTNLLARHHAQGSDFTSLHGQQQYITSSG